jgi:hypothetical protein
VSAWAWPVGVEDALACFARRIRAVAPRLDLATVDAVLAEAAQHIEGLATDGGAQPIETRRRIS